MANLTPINGSMRLPEAWPIIKENTEKVNADIIAHKTDTDAHKAESITYDGAVSGANNVRDAINKQSERIESIIANSGDSNAEIVDARHDTVSSVTFVTLGARLNALSDYLNYMPIDGGEFDGNNPVGPTIDGGTY